MITCKSCTTGVFICAEVRAAQQIPSWGGLARQNRRSRPFVRVRCGEAYTVLLTAVQFIPYVYVLVCVCIP